MDKDRILEYRGGMYSLTDLRETLKKQSKMEKLVFDGILTGKRINEMTELEQRTFCDEIIFAMTAYGGCLLPQSDIFAEKLSGLIISFLHDTGYSNLTTREVMLAFEFNADEQMDWPNSIQLPRHQFDGSYANIGFLSKILSNYKTVRSSLIRRLQNLIDGYENQERG